MARLVPAAAEAGKVGNVFIVNRLTGKLIRKSPPFVMVNENFMKPVTATPITIYPGNKGGAMWSPPAYSPQTKYFYTMGVNEAHDFVVNQPLPDIYKPGTPIAGQYSGGGMATNLKVFPPSGTFSAINTTTGAIDWQYKSDRPMYGGALATAGGLVFTGEMNGDFDAFDAKSGEKLWHYPAGRRRLHPAHHLQDQGRAIYRGGRQRLPWRRSADACRRPPDLRRQFRDFCITGKRLMDTKTKTTLEGISTATLTTVLLKKGPAQCLAARRFPQAARSEARGGHRLHLALCAGARRSGDTGELGLAHLHPRRDRGDGRRRDRRGRRAWA